MKFYIKDRLYDAAAIQSLTLAKVMEFDNESRRNNYGFLFSDLEELNARITKIPAEQRKREPGLLLILSITIWASRLAAGEDISYADAIDVSMADLVFINDVQEGKKSQDPRRTRKGSHRAGKKQRHKASVSARSASSRKSDRPQSGGE